MEITTKLTDILEKSVKEKSQFLIAFISDNGLIIAPGFTNTPLVAIIGLGLYLNLKDTDVFDCINSTTTYDSSKWESEFARLWVYCDNNNYGDWWKDEQLAIKTYKF